MTGSQAGTTLVGFTALQRGVDRLVIGQEADDELGTFNGRFVETGDYRHLPGFWH